MQKLENKDIEGYYVKKAGNKTIVVTWESPTLLILDFHNTADVDKDDYSPTMVGTLKIRVK